MRTSSNQSSEKKGKKKKINIAGLQQRRGLTNDTRGLSDRNTSHKAKKSRKKRAAYSGKEFGE